MNWWLNDYKMRYSYDIMFKVGSENDVYKVRLQ